MGGVSGAFALAGGQLLAWVVGGAICLFLLVPMLVAAGVGVSGGGGGNEVDIGQVGGIPAVYVPMYNAAAREYRVNPYVLAGIHDVETTFGESSAPGVSSGVNSYGCCGGPMQFWVLEPGATWDGYRDAYLPIASERPADYPLHQTDHPSPYDSFDAIAAAALMLHRDGADPSLDSQATWNAIWDYNHADWYVDEVLGLARRWAAADALASTPSSPQTLPLISEANGSVLLNGLASAPREAPASVQAMIAAGNRLDGQPYWYGGGHGSSLDALSPNGYDCSSSVSYLLHAGGLLGASALTSGQLERWGAPGPGRWVTVYANSAHTFMYVAGLRMDTSRDGTDDGPNAAQDGPRWRVLAQVPAWAPWVVRHPPGL
ncbi:MAG TPA: hypothetical protein VN635_01215 [Conexibacter sp.]|nr:hypothetical protein [Conexibacter sp.]